MRPGLAVERHEVRAVERDDRRRHRARRDEPGDAVTRRAAARGWRCARRRARRRTARRRGRGVARPPRARSAVPARAVARAPRRRGARSSRVAPAPACGLGHRHARRADRDELLPELGGEAHRLVVTKAIERHGAFGETSEHVDDRLLLVGRVEIHEVRILHTDARSHLPGPARRRARGGHHARRGRARARRRRAPHLRRARPPCPRVGRRRSRRAACATATTSPRCSRTRSTPTSRCSRWRGCGWSRCRSTSRSPGACSPTRSTTPT